MDRSILQKESADGLPRASLLAGVSGAVSGAVPGAVPVAIPGAMSDSIVLSRRAGMSGPRSFVDGSRPSLPATDRQSELLRLGVPPQPPQIDPLRFVVWLVVVAADDRPSGTLIPLRSWLWSKGEVTIGRELADLKFGNQALSKTHLGIQFDDTGEGFVVRDLGSTNGSFLAPDQRSPFFQVQNTHPLRDGNVLRMGDVQLVFRCYFGPAIS